MNLKDYNFVNEFKTNIEIKSFLVLNHKNFLCFFSDIFGLHLYHYEIVNENKIEEKSIIIFDQYRYAIKYGDKLIFCKYNEIFLIDPIVQKIDFK